MKKYWIRDFNTRKSYQVNASSERAALRKAKVTLENATITQWRELTGWTATTEALMRKKLVMHNQQLVLLEDFISEFEDK